MTALNCSDRKYCSLTHVLKNAHIKLCPHRLASSACQNCKDKKLVPVKITPFWILNSGASLHFTEEKRDFITFQELPIPFPIHTANSSTHITGKGSVVLKYLNSKNQEVTTNIPSVFFCEDLTCRLLSLGAFLQDGLTVEGNKGVVMTKNTNGPEHMTFETRMLMDMIYMLQTLD